MEAQLRKYAPLWNKYRPAILKMMLAAGEQPQQYKLMQHEIAAMETRKKTGFSFTLQISGGKPSNTIKDSEIAQDLFNMLRSSPKGTELLEANAYEIALDKNFTLHVSKLNDN